MYTDLILQLLLHYREVTKKTHLKKKNTRVYKILRVHEKYLMVTSDFSTW